jgi:hydrogenase 3 maturation protease
MSEKLWQEKLRQTMAGLRPVNGQPRVAVVGIGHELRGDDAAGVAVARLLNRLAHSPSLQVIEAGAAPENCCGLLFRFHPDLVLFVDAAQMGADPGTVRWLAWDQIGSGDAAGFNVSTHTLPLPILANYLRVELACPVGLLGIQPADISLGDSLSPAVGLAVEATARALVDLLSVAEGAAIPCTFK